MTTKTAARRIGLQGSVALVAAIATGMVAAQGYPAKPTKVLVPFGPGTGVDVVARIVSEALAKSLGQPFVVENRPGASGAIASAAVAQATPDGHTLLVNVSSHTSVPAMVKSLPYDALRDFAGVTTLAESPLVLVIARSRGIATVADLVAAARAKPGTITYASAGVGTTTHISAEKLRLAAGFEGLHVPFKSTTDALVDVTAGRIAFIYTALASALPGIRDGRLVPLAMASKRTPVLPEVPSIAEAGHPKAAYSLWFGMLTAAKTPREVVNRLNQELVRQLAAPDMKERLAKIGADAFTMAPEEFDAMIRRELAENDALVKAVGIKTE